MIAIDAGLVGILVIGSIVLLIAVFGRMSHHDRLLDFLADCSRHGMAPDEAMAAVSIRIAFAKLRRMSSDECVARAGDYDRANINRIAGDLAVGIAAGHGKEAAKSFMGWIDSCPDHEILYDDARKARTDYLDRLSKPEYMRDPQLEADIRAAFTIIGR